MVATGSLLAAFAFMILVFLRLAPGTDLRPLDAPRVRNDPGSMLLAFLTIPAYQEHSPYRLIWSGNLREEIPWHVRSQTGGWGWAAVALMILGFGLPFLPLLVRLVETIWLVGPGLGVGAACVLWAVAATLGLGAAWRWWFRRLLAARPLLSIHDPRLASPGELAPEAEHAAA